MSNSKKSVDRAGSEPAILPTCGIIMPISALDGCDESHWAEVLQIIKDSITSADLEPNLVSNADEVGVIQKRIIQNLYENPIVVCDVSGKNANVMFELGIRLAFDKPVVIIKDDRTSYSFDTSPIEHITYPRDLRFSKILDFRNRLAGKIAATLAQVNDDPNFSPFIAHFGNFKVVKLQEEEVPAQEFILEELKSIRKQMVMQSISVRRQYNGDDDDDGPTKTSVCMKGMPESEIERTINFLSKKEPSIHFGIRKVGPNHHHVDLDPIGGDQGSTARARAYLSSVRKRSHLRPDSLDATRNEVIPSERR